MIEESDRKKINSILSFWFGSVEDRENIIDIDKRINSLWFSRNKENSDKLKNKFMDLLEDAKRGEYSNWVSEPYGRLALIVLLDQFSRHIYYNDMRAYEGDKLALKYSLEGVDTKLDRKIKPIERVFFYMPLIHSEYVEYVEKGLNLLKKLRKYSPKYLIPEIDNSIEFAKHHIDLLENFGRYPHRNKILGRRNTKEETEYLKYR